MHVLIEAILERPSRPAVERRDGWNTEAPDDIGVHDVGATAVTVDDAGDTSRTPSEVAWRSERYRRRGTTISRSSRARDRAARETDHRPSASSPTAKTVTSWLRFDCRWRGALADALETADASRRQQVDDSRRSRPPLVIAPLGEPARP